MHCSSSLVASLHASPSQDLILQGLVRPTLTAYSIWTRNESKQGFGIDLPVCSLRLFSICRLLPEGLHSGIQEGH